MHWPVASATPRGSMRNAANSAAPWRRAALQPPGYVVCKGRRRCAARWGSHDPTADFAPSHFAYVHQRTHSPPYARPARRECGRRSSAGMRVSADG
ncbi:hypothetical protein [Lysobacter gummosus]|uniref:hypothetical protein n=1 Tax=Lysobacter gummosus TaxID=262324 RepID=UPI003640C3C0